jgi:hypothetical protein
MGGLVECELYNYGYNGEAFVQVSWSSKGLYGKYSCDKELNQPDHLKVGSHVHGQPKADESLRSPD